jgi:hypothetical protein
VTGADKLSDTDIEITGANKGWEWAYIMLIFNWQGFFLVMTQAG